MNTYISSKPITDFSDKTLINLTKQYCLDTHITYNPHLTKTFKKALKEVYPELSYDKVKHSDEDSGFKKGEVIVVINPIYTTRFVMAYKKDNNTLVSVMDNHLRVIYSIVYPNSTVYRYDKLKDMILKHEQETSKSVYVITNDSSLCKNQNCYYINKMINPAMFEQEQKITDYNIHLYINNNGQFAPPTNTGRLMFEQWLAWVFPQIKQKNACYWLDNITDTNVYHYKTASQIYKQYCLDTNTNYVEDDLPAFGRLISQKYTKISKRINGMAVYVYDAKKGV
jgi:hypothetical protein